MKGLAVFPILLMAVLSVWAAPVRSQVRDDYLTEEEVALVRKAEDPDRKVQLFVDFAENRLTKLEAEIADAGKNLEKRRRVLEGRFDEYIRAVDDLSGHVEMWLERGNADLTKFRKRMDKTGPHILERLTLLEESNPELAESDLRYELEDAVEATHEMLALILQIPEGMMPPNFGARKREAEIQSLPAEPGKPTLRRRGEDEAGQKKEDTKEKPPPR